ncbi:MAG: adenylate/guanylate cyclase domain-containing protein [Nitrososphaera sp.]
MSDDSYYDEFPVVPTAPKTSGYAGHLVDEVSFSGNAQDVCVCYVDMMNSTQVAATLGPSSIAPYYSEFLNSMSTIIANFGAEIVKTAGDAVIYYFPQTANKHDICAFKNALECSLYMMAAHRHINNALSLRRLPPVNYRISADYGTVQVAKSPNSSRADLFGQTMNRCAKINTHAPANGTVICDTLHEVVSSLSEYAFDPLGTYKVGGEDHVLYSLKSREKRNILDPFIRPSPARPQHQSRKA